MTREIRWDARARKDAGALDRSVAERVASAIERLRSGTSGGSRTSIRPSIASESATGESSSGWSTARSSSSACYRVTRPTDDRRRRDLRPICSPGFVGWGRIWKINLPRSHSRTLSLVSRYDPNLPFHGLRRMRSMRTRRTFTGSWLLAGSPPWSRACRKRCSAIL
jgi:hypothetical protein